MIDTPGPSLTAMSRNSAPCVIPCGSQLGSAGDLPWFATLLRYDVAGTLSCTGVWPRLDDQRLYFATRLFGRHPSRFSAPLVFALRVACVCACVLVRLSHPRPPDRSQHGCTVGVLPGPTRVLPVPWQYGIGRRAPTRAVLSCAASWCVVVRRIHGLWNMPSVRFVLCPLAPLLDMVTAVALSILRDTSHHTWLISFADMTDL